MPRRTRSEQESNTNQEEKQEEAETQPPPQRARTEHPLTLDPEVPPQKSHHQMEEEEDCQQPFHELESQTLADHLDSEIQMIEAFHIPWQMPRSSRNGAKS